MPVSEIEGITVRRQGSACDRLKPLFASIYEKYTDSKVNCLTSSNRKLG